MKKFINRFKTTPTIFLIGGVAAILYSIPAILYYIPKNGGESMYALLYFYLMFFACVALIIDSGLINAVNFKMVSVIEALLIISIYFIISYNGKKATIDITAIKKPYIIIIDDPKGIVTNEFKSAGLFNKEYKTKDTDLIRINK